MFFLWDAIGQQISKFNLFRFRTRMHSSRMRTARSSSQVFSSVHAGIHPLGVGLETPLGVGLETHPGQTPQLPPGCGPGNLQGLLGYHPPAARHAGIPPAMHAGIPHPHEQNDRQVQKYYLAPNFVCGR